MLHYIHTRSFVGIILFMVLALVTWSMISTRQHTKYWRRRNILLTLLISAAILYAPLFNRSKGSTGLILVPFSALAAARQQPELYRELLMNVFLFFQLGLTLSNALPWK